MDLLSHVRSFTQKHSEAVEIKKKKKNRRRRERKKEGGQEERGGEPEEHVLSWLLGSAGILQQAARLRNA
jgi:hypothetical protein